MTTQEILAHVDHTLLKADADWLNIQRLCEEAVRFRTASVCVPPSYVGRIHEQWPELNLCTVIGFPLGYAVASAKRAELEDAAKDGANEFDMVINLGDVKNGEFEKITREIGLLKQVAGSRVLKVIVETCCLTESEKSSVCRCVTEGRADFIKTSTGFGTKGAELSDIALFRREIGPSVKIKAAGGIRTREQMVAFLEAGCERIGSSNAVSLLAGGSSEA